MNPKKLAEAYRTLSMGYAELADAYLDDTPEPSTWKGPPPSALVAPSFDELPPEEWGEPAPALAQEATAEQGFAAICPKHRKPYLPGKFGPYCPIPVTDDPEWTDKKGYCRITPKNAAAYLRERSGVPA